MGDRVGGLRLDFSTNAKLSSDNTHPYMPNLPVYPPTIVQYSAPATESPYNPAYVPASEYGTATFSNIRFNVTLKAIAVVMTPWNASLYNQYASQYSVSPSTYIVQYPTDERSPVTRRDFIIGAPSKLGGDLAPPTIGPTLNESQSKTVVLMNPGDAAFITVSNEDAAIYYTTNGSDPIVSSQLEYTPGTRITVSGAAGTRLTVKAISVKGNQVSAVVTQSYEIASNVSDVPIFAPIINYPSGTYSTDSAIFQTNGLRVYSPSYRTNCYYTMDGIDPDPPKLNANLGYGSRDMTVWEDPKTGVSYLVTFSDNIYGRIWQLTDDLTDVVPNKEYDVFVDTSREAPALIRHGGPSGKFVYLMTSAQSGWYANQGQYKRTSDFSAAFSFPRDKKTGYRNGTSVWSELAPVGDPSTFGSQPSWIQNIGTDRNPAYVYIGDRYNALNLSMSTYVFMSLFVDDNEAGEDQIVGSGNMTLMFDPLPAIDVVEKTVQTPSWMLLSLNKPVEATPATTLTASQAAAGTYNYSASVANDGSDYDVDAYDAIAQYYLPSSVPYFWQVDLGNPCNVSWVGLSFRSVGGSDAVERYYLSGSKDNVTWDELADDRGNSLPGFKSHLVSGSYRYVRLDTTSIWDVVHGTSAAWEAGLYEMSVYGNC
ncbi:coagulation factor 5 8 type domain-containing protein [Penicillium lagena]|uniref:coagulation factor 5 8 type domain-containing protein n=1 Tax=Penicillium lagena TaxID=94218 RepID=UPI0025402DDA|nr:coagulation factor 5 8 type domain-containing protein [Penicillium lagena]KAJ5610552.1 coagulation factor 5 8 type domain-containing protein [Penicillium lagena]